MEKPHGGRKGAAVSVLNATPEPCSATPSPVLPTFRALHVNSVNLKETFKEILLYRNLGFC